MAMSPYGHGAGLGTDMTSAVILRPVPMGRVRVAAQPASCRIAASSPGRSNIGQCQPNSSR
jgi:hypothetical protein